MDSDPDIPFIKLLTDYQMEIRALVFSLLPGEPGVDDVIQDTNVLIWEKRSEFEWGTNFRAWAFQIARYQVMTHYRSLTLQRQRWTVLDEDVAEMLADEVDRLVDYDFMESRLQALKTCIQRIRPVDRDLLLERYWHNTRLLDLAKSEGRSFSALKVRFFRLRAALKQCIEEQTGEEAV